MSDAMRSKMPVDVPVACERSARHGRHRSEPGFEVLAAIDVAERLAVHGIDGHLMEMHDRQRHVRLRGLGRQVVIPRQQLLVECDAARQKHQMLGRLQRAEIVEDVSEARESRLCLPAPHHQHLPRLGPELVRARLGDVRRQFPMTFALDDHRNRPRLAPLVPDGLFPRDVVIPLGHRRRTRHPANEVDNRRVVSRGLDGACRQTDGPDRIARRELRDQVGRGLQHRQFAAGSNRGAIDGDDDDSSGWKFSDVREP